MNTTLPIALAEVVLQPGGEINGSITVTPLDGGTTQSMTASDGAIGHFSDFDIAAGHAVNCVQPGANASALFRIFSGDGTQILGQFDANGNIFLVDPAGILFGANSQINVNQLVASSLDIDDGDFLAGQYEFFAGEGNIGTIVNDGTINAAAGAALIGSKILNTGTITAGEGGFVVMVAGDRVLLGEPGSKIVVEMDSVTLTDPENPEGFGDVVNEGEITAPGGTIVLAAGDIFSTALDPDPVRVESGVGLVVQDGVINADSDDGDGGSVTLTAGDEVILAEGSLTTANGGVSNTGANGGEVIAYASQMFVNDAIVRFEADAVIEVMGGSPEDPAAIDAEATFDGGLAEISGDHLFFDGTVDATSEPFDVPDPENPGEFITITPDGGTLHIDPVTLTLADGGIPEGGAAIDTFYEQELEAYSQDGVDTVLEGDYSIVVEHMSDGGITGGKGEIALRTAYNNGGIEFMPDPGTGEVTTTIRTTGGGDIFMLAGSGGIVTGDLITEENNGGNPGRIRIFTNNGGAIETGALLVDGGNDVEVSVIASGELAINGDVITNTNKVPANYDKTGTAYICLISESGSVNVLGAVEVEAHGKEQTLAQIHICADNTVSVHTGNGRVQAIAKTSSAGTADAGIRIHAGSEEEGAITVIRDGSDPIRVQANTSGASIGPLDFTDTVTEYEQTTSGSHVFVQIADAWLGDCPDCPTPPDLPPPVEPPDVAPIAVADDYTIGKSDILVIILDADGVLINDYDPDGEPGDIIIAILLGDGTTAQEGTVVLEEDGGFEYTPPEVKEFDDGFGTDAEGDYALFIDTFSYYVEDPDGLSSNEATVTITSKNYIPVANPDFYDVSHNVPLDVADSAAGTIEGLLPAYADTDADPGDTLSAVLDGGGTTALGGSVVLNADGTFNYTPPGGVVGTDSFTYYATDGYNNSETVEVTIELTNALPVANPDFYDVSHNVVLDITDIESGTIEGLLPEFADTDADPGDTLTAILDGDGTTSLGGLVELNADGTFTYTPLENTVGEDTFSYYVTDGFGNSESVLVTMFVGSPPVVAVPYIQPAPGLQREVIESSGCPALVQWVASEIGTDESKIQIWMANSLASAKGIQPCDACADFKEAATILQDADGTRVAALAGLINEFASSTAPPTEEQMASIADAIANDIEGNVQYAEAGEYLDALAKYVGILNSEMGFSADESIQFATDNYVEKLAEGENVGVAAFVAANLVTLGGSQ